MFCLVLPLLHPRPHLLYCVLQSPHSIFSESAGRVKSSIPTTRSALLDKAILSYRFRFSLEALSMKLQRLRTTSHLLWLFAECL